MDHALEPSTGLLDASTLAAIIGLIGILAAAVLLWRRAARRPASAGAAVRAAAVGILWWFLLLAPTSSVVPISDLVAEHRVYLALAGLLLAAVVGADALAARWLSGPRMLAAAAVVGAALWGIAFARASTWQSEAALWLDAAEKNPGSARAAGNHAYALQQAGRIDAARAEYARALRLPDSPIRVAAVAMNYSAFEMDRGDMAAALAIADIGVAAAPKRFEVRANRSLALGALGRLEEALADARICVAVAPKDPFPHYVHGVALYRLGRLDEARRAFTEALVREGTLALRPTFAALGRREEGCAAWVGIEATGQATAGLHKSAVNLGCVQR